MATKTLSQVASRVYRAPISIVERSLQSTPGSWEWRLLTTHGLTLTAGVTSTALTEVINITGSGVITQMYSMAGSNDNVSPAKCRITIDGVVVVDLTTISVTPEKITAYVGGMLANTSGVDAWAMWPGAVAFHRSLVVEIAGQTSETHIIAWARYLT